MNKELKLNEKEKKEMLKLAVNDEDQLDGLLEYYRSRVSDFDAEREEWLSRLENLKYSEEEKHKQQWTLQEKTEQVYTLQNNIGDYQLKLQQERQMVCQLQQAQAQLTQAQQQDHLKIADLMALNTVYQQHTHLNKDKRPQVVTQHPTSTLINKLRDNQQEVLLKQMNLGVDTSQKTAGRQVTNHIHLPGEQQPSPQPTKDHHLQQQVDSLHKQLTLLKTQWQNRQLEYSSNMQEMQQQLKQVLHQAQQAEHKLYLMTKDFFHQKVQHSQQIQSLQQHNQTLRNKNLTLADQLHKQSDYITNSLKVAQALDHQKTNDYLHAIRQEATLKDTSNQQAAAQGQRIQKIYLEKVKSLEEALKTLMHKYTELEKRRARECREYRARLAFVQMEEVGDKAQEHKSKENINTNTKEQESNNIKVEENINGKEQESKKTMKAKSKKKENRINSAKVTLKEGHKNRNNKQKERESSKKERRTSQKEKESNKKEKQYRDYIQEVNHQNNNLDDTVNIQELELLKTQLEHLEKKLDLARHNS